MSDSIDLNQAVGGILFKRVMNDVVEEICHLKEKIEKQMPMLDHLNKIKIRFGIELHQPFDNTMKEEDISASFYGATVQGSFVRISLAGCNPIPLRKMRSGMLIISDQVAENFHCDYADLVVFASNVDDKPFIQLALYKHSGTVLSGRVEGLNEEDKLKIINNSEQENRVIFEGYFMRGRCLNSPDAVFISRTLTIPLSPRLNERLQLIDTATNDSVHPSNDSRHSLIDAIGGESDMKLLRENSSLKFKAEAFPKIHKLIGRVEIDQENSYHGSCLSPCYNLSSGKLVSEYSNGHPTNPQWSPAWVLPVSYVHHESAHPKVYLAGVKIENLGHLRNTDSYLFNTSNPQEFIGPHIRIRNPRFNVTELAFWLGGVKETLNLLGIDYNESDSL